MRSVVGQSVVDILEALGLHGFRLFLVSCALSILIVWFAWRIGTYHLVARKSKP